MKKKILMFMFVMTSILFANDKHEARSYLLGDSKGNIYYEQNSKIKYPLASLTKIMTLLVVYDEIRAGNIKETDKITIDKEIASVMGSSIPLKIGEKISVGDLIKAASIQSANNASYSLAKYIGKGNVDKFVEKMNLKVKKLGLEKELKYYTPTGLPPVNTNKKMDVGTSYGIYKLSLEALNYPEYLKIANLKKAKIKNGKYELKSTIKLLEEEGIYGLKTGYHSKAKYNISVLSKKNDTNLVTIVIGMQSVKIRDDEVLKINERFYDEYEKKYIAKTNTPLLYLPVKNGYVEKVAVYSEKNVSKILKKNSKVLVVAKTIDEIDENMSKGKIGTYSVMVDEKEIYVGNLLIKSDILVVKNKKEKNIL